jgi:hypothetical protein
MLSKNPGIYRRKQAGIEALFVATLHWFCLAYFPTLKMEATSFFFFLRLRLTFTDLNGVMSQRIKLFVFVTIVTKKN